MMRRQDQQSRVFCDLSALIFNILRSPPSPIQLSGHIPTPSPALSSLPRPPVPSLAQITPMGVASLLFGLSLALILCGSVTFFIGFILMPWVLGLVMVLYFFGIVSGLSMRGRTVLSYATSLPSPLKEVPGSMLAL